MKVFKTSIASIRRIKTYSNFLCFNLWIFNLFSFSFPVFFKFLFILLFFSLLEVNKLTDLQKQLWKGWHCGHVDTAAALNSSNPYELRFLSSLLHIPSSSLQMTWEKQLKRVMEDLSLYVSPSHSLSVTLSNKLIITTTTKASGKKCSEGPYCSMVKSMFLMLTPHLEMPDLIVAILFAFQPLLDVF